MSTDRRIQRIALAYSGGLDTSVMIPWLRANYDCEVVAVVADVGQEEDFEAVRAKAIATGAVACEVVDLKAEFAAEYLFPALRAGAVYEHGYLLGTALARPLIAKAQVEVALAHGCDALAHGCTGKGNDQVRFEVTYRTLAPQLRVVAPWREWDLRSREDEFAYAEARGISLPITPEKPYSIDQNLWHTSTEGGVLEDPAMAPPDDIYQMTTDPADAPDEPRVVEIEGMPIESRPEGHMLMIRNRDVPGVVGKIGTILGRSGVNIAGIHLGRTTDREGAVSIVDVDHPVPAEAIAEIESFEEITRVRSVLV